MRLGYCAGVSRWGCCTACTRLDSLLSVCVSNTQPTSLILCGSTGSAGLRRGLCCSASRVPGVLNAPNLPPAMFWQNLSLVTNTPGVCRQGQVGETCVVAALQRTCRLESSWTIGEAHLKAASGNKQECGTSGRSTAAERERERERERAHASREARQKPLTPSCSLSSSRSCTSSASFHKALSQGPSQAPAGRADRTLTQLSHPAGALLVVRQRSC